MRQTSSVGRTNSAGQRGVTLVEMMVVAIVIALIVSITTPSVSAGIDAVRLTTATTSVAAFLNSAVTRAQRRQQPVELIVNIAQNSLQFLSTEAGSARELTLPDGIVLEGVVANGVSEEEPEADHRLLFLPGGAIPSVGIAIANHHGGRRIVRLDPMTGFPRVERVENK